MYDDIFSLKCLIQYYQLKEEIVIDGVTYHIKSGKKELENGSFQYWIRYVDENGFIATPWVGDFVSFFLDTEGKTMSEARERLKIEMIKMEQYAKVKGVKPSRKRKETTKPKNFDY